MKPHPRIRKTVKWAGAAVSLVLLVAWIESGWMSLPICNSKSLLMAFTRGRLLLGRTNNPSDVLAPDYVFATTVPMVPQTRTSAMVPIKMDRLRILNGNQQASIRLNLEDVMVSSIGRSSSHLHNLASWFDWYLGRSAWIVAIPLWILPGTSLLITALAWRADTLNRRRTNLNLCTECHYDRAGLPPHALCPECGSPATSTLLDPSATDQHR